MMWIINLVTAPIRRILALVTTILLLVVTVFYAGKRSERQKRAEKRARDMEAIADDLAESAETDPGTAREWLRRFRDQ